MVSPLPLDVVCFLFFCLFVCFYEFQHSPIKVFLATSCDFGGFIGEDEHTSFYPAISLIGGDQNHPQEKGKMVVLGGLTNS